MSDDASWEACLVGERVVRMLDIVDRVTQALLELDGRFPQDGWMDYLTMGASGALQPYWSKMIFAGYSAGANQSAFHTRFLRPHSAIFYSGGGDGARPSVAPSGTGTCWSLPGEDCRAISPAGWMQWPPLSDGYVAYQHVYEACDFTNGWNLDQVGRGEVSFESTDVVDVADFGDQPRLERTDVVVPANKTLEQAAHNTALEASYGMLLVHTHLVCKADGA